MTQTAHEKSMTAAEAIIGITSQANDPALAARGEFQLKPQNTAISRKGPSKPLTLVLDAGAVGRTDRVLDFGCGLGDDVGELKRQQFDVVGHDPGGRIAEFLSDPTGEFDFVLMFYVLNVLPDEERRAALDRAWSYVKRGGRLCIAARPKTDVEREARSKGWKAHGDGYISSESRATFQRGLTCDELGAACRLLPEVDSVVPSPASGFSFVTVRRK